MKWLKVFHQKEARAKVSTEVQEKHNNPCTATAAFCFHHGWSSGPTSLLEENSAKLMLSVQVREEQVPSGDISTKTSIKLPGNQKIPTLFLSHSFPYNVQKWNAVSHPRSSSWTEENSRNWARVALTAPHRGHPTAGQTACLTGTTQKHSPPDQGS